MPGTGLARTAPAPVRVLCSTLLKWVAPLLPEDRLEVEIVHAGDAAGGPEATADERHIRLAAYGARWAARMPALTEHVAPWR